MELTLEKRDAIATLCLMAAFADGQKDDNERDRIKEIFDSLGAGFSPSLYTRVVLGQADINAAADTLDAPALRTLAYEMAVGVCDADGATTGDEKAFLERLSTALGLDAAASRAFLAQGDALATLPLDSAEPVPAVASTGPAGALKDDPILDALILKYAVINGGLELLPQSLASMAIIPLQMKLVYSVGQHYGYALDQGHIRELLATVGVGMTSQVVENFARKIVGGVLKGTLGKMGSAATGAAVTFASTYAVGHVARSYYSAGRKLEPETLKRMFSEHVERGKALFTSHQPAVEASARNTDVGSLLKMVRG
ncbi:MAG: DUF533 domain-containing protein [Rhodothermales bacterium]|nr:DUF533 domain-containing protein [Rhodothermales bacterium]